MAWNGSTEAVKGSDVGVGVVSEDTVLANGSDLNGLSPYTKMVVKGYSMSGIHRGGKVNYKGQLIN